MIKLNFYFRQKLLSFILYPLSFLIATSCTGLVKLSLPPENEITEENSWLKLGRNEQRQNNVHKNISPPLNIVWDSGTKSVVTNHPLAVGDYIFAPTLNGTIYTFLYDTGERIGDGKLTAAMGASPTIVGRDMYASGTIGDKTLIGFRLEKADKFMKRKFPHINTSPVVVDNRIFFGSHNGVFYCVNQETGEKIWEFKAKSPIRSSPATVRQHIYFADDKGSVYALDMSSGVKIWESQLTGNIYSYPVLDDSLLYIGTTEGHFYALNLSTGKTNWQTKIEGAIFSSPSMYGNTLYLGNNAHTVKALDKHTGKTIWTFKTGGIVNTAPLASPDYVYVSSWDGNLYVLNRFSGESVYQVEFKKPLKSSPIIFRDYVLVQTANGKMYALANEKFVAERSDRK